MNRAVFAAALVALIGCGSGKKGEAQSEPLCPVASTCAMRQYCNASQSCRCLRSAEGDIRCGTPPSCGVKQCTKSSDCADLGPGFFCDSVGSGCCGDDKQRCIGPCVGETCPASRICAGKCCPEGQICAGNRCSGDGGVPDAPVRPDASPPPDRTVVPVPDRPAAELATMSRDAAVDAPIGGGAGGSGGGGGEGGAGGASAATPSPTMQSIAAARAMLAAGATDVPLNADGSWRHVVTVVGGVPKQEKLVVNGREVLIHDHDGDRTTSRQDADGDGFFEWEQESVRTRGTPDGRRTVTRRSLSTREPTERTSYTRVGSTMTVVTERHDATKNMLAKVREYSHPAEIEAHAEAEPIVSAQTIITPCTPAECDPTVLDMMLTDAVNRGIRCLHNNAASDLEQRLVDAVRRVDLKAKCDGSLPLGVIAQIDPPIGYELRDNPTIDIKVNLLRFCDTARGPGRDRQLANLFHEVTHLDDPSHIQEQAENLQRRQDVDRMYACQDFCFRPPADVSQCACATCLGTAKCDPRCAVGKGFTTCPDDFGAWCPCQTRLRWYQSCSQCLSNCPSGLGCFGFSWCIPEPKGLCGPARKCPP